MENQEPEYNKLKLQNMINMRNIWTDAIVPLTGCMSALLRDTCINFKLYKAVFLIIGSGIDCLFVKMYYDINTDINELLKKIRGR